jgi:2'-5' RNA ligase
MYMVKRYIAIFPDFEAADPIHDLRKRFDPIGLLVPPHITLVFPFESKLETTTINNHISQTLTKARQFPVSLDSVSTHGEYLLLDIKIGKAEITNLHDRLYDGILSHYLRSEFSYIPHVTVAKNSDNNILTKANEMALQLPLPYHLVVNSLRVMIISDDERSEKLEIQLPMKV